MAPEILEALETAELGELARKIKDYQDAKSLSFAALLKRYPGVGSDKTFGKILKGDWTEMDVEKQLANYRAVWALMESLGSDDQAEEELYEDIGPAVHLRRAFISARRDTGIARLILLEADTGDGKTSAQRILREKYGQGLILIEATVVWNDSPLAMLGQILSAFGVKNPPLNQMIRFDMALEHLTQRRVAVVIEEAHHMGPKCCNLIKTLINQSPGEFILLAMPTLWARMNSSAYEEVRQLVGNRLAVRIRVDSWGEKDIEKFISRRVPRLGDQAEAARKLIMPHLSKANGNMAFVREVCKAALEKGDDLTLEQFSACIQDELRKRGTAHRGGK